ncbi:MAG TPA: 50S ribosomal protein L33 [Dehalococcoidia bacterium]|nr:50S ribosomal protein L33 [Dehalococcoidia bacterium]
MAKKKGGLCTIIHLACSQCQQRTYTTAKNKNNDPQKLELKKYCPRCRIHTLYREVK